MNDMYFVAYFKMRFYPMFLFYCIWKYDVI